MWHWKSRGAGRSTHQLKSLKIRKHFLLKRPTFSVLSLFNWPLIIRLRFPVFGVVGGIDVQGRGCGLHGGGAGAAGLHPEEAVPRRDAGELPEPGLSG